MRAQLEIQDAEGRNLAMLAARCGNVAILKSVMAEIHHTGVRERAVCADLAAIFLEPSQNSRKRSFASISLLDFVIGGHVAAAESTPFLPHTTGLDTVLEGYPLNGLAFDRSPRLGRQLPYSRVGYSSGLGDGGGAAGTAP